MIYPTPYPYQDRIARDLSQREKALFSGEMGIGKTVISITAANLASCSNVLIICPASLVTNWERELAPDMWMLLANVTVISYNKVTQPKHFDRLRNIAWDVVIIDEAHYLKNPTSKRARAVYAAGGIASKAKRLWLLSGTFTPNNASELWTHLQAVAPDKVSRSFYNFRNHYCIVAESAIPGRNRDGSKRKSTKILGNRNVGELNQLLAPITIKCKAKDVLPDLPPLQFNKVFVAAQDALGVTQEMKAFSDHAKDISYLMAEMIRYLEEGDVEAAKELERDLNLEHLARALRYLSILKAGATVDFVKELLNSTEKVVVIGKHRQALELISKGLDSSAIPTVKVDGSTSMKKRSRWIDEFQRSEDPKVFVGQVNACGVGITLTRANHIVFAEQSWVPSDNIQAAKRCHRIGQEQPVFIHVLTIPNSLDEVVQGVLILKQTMINQYNL